MKELRAAALLVALSLVPAAEAKEPLPTAPRLALGGEASLSYAPEDTGYFNDAAYGHNLTRLLRLDLLGSFRLAPGLEALFDLRSENLDSPQVYALYLRYRPFAPHELDLQAGRIPPVFGTFPRRRYAQENPLVSWPLVWQYLTTLRPDALPASADALLLVRGSGWRAPYPGYGAAAGVPTASAARWDTGVEARYANGPLELAVALTRGTLSDPRFEDSNDGKQLSARVGWQPLAGLGLGASIAEGEFLDAALPLPRGRYDQRAYGLDAELALGRVVFRAEAVYAEWDEPATGQPPIDRPLSARGYYLEGRWRFAPGWHVAARLDRLGFGDIRGSEGLEPWEAPVRRLEAGFGFVPRRHVLVKAVYQRNRRDYGFVQSQDLVAAQAVLWF
ncbi:MAG TPA: hypothetical protein VFM88_01650 [Vicinamibacteria bacterium]|nr:hypothetical protein [Vicinamibacteria bacterium]